MFSRSHRLMMGLPCCLLLAVAGGCQANRAAVAPQEPPAVPIAQPVQREVTDYVDFTGRTEAVHSVDIRPRVTGYLVKMPFTGRGGGQGGRPAVRGRPAAVQGPARPGAGTGRPVQGLAPAGQGHPGPRPRHQLAAPGSISQQQFDQEQAVVDEAEARVVAYEKSMEIYTLSHEFTNVTSPIDGQISRYYLTLGNLVNQDSTLLTTVMSVDPMYAYFEMDESTRWAPCGRSTRGRSGCPRTARCRS